MHILSTLAHFGKSILVNNHRNKSMKNKLHTPLIGEDVDNKIDIIEHVNLEHRDELLFLLQAFTKVEYSPIPRPIIDNIYQEGVVIRYLPKTINEKSTHSISDNTHLSQTSDNLINHHASQTIFIPFRINNATLEEQFFYLVYEAAIRQGESIQDNNRRYFEVMSSYKVTENMLRLCIKSNTPLPSNAPGYAFNFVITALTQADTHSDNLSHKLWQKLQTQLENLSHTQKLFSKAVNKGQLLIFEVFKHLPTQQRNKIARQSGRYQTRYYTLRQVIQKHNDNSYYANIDVFIHGQTIGSNWAAKLKSGDIIYSERDIEERTEHLHTGQALLICDETSMPTVAACIENWQNSIAPIIIHITQNTAEQHYFDNLQPSVDNNQNIDFTLIPLTITNIQHIADEVIKSIQALNISIDCAWGALESSQAKKIKKYLREQHQLSAKMNQIKGYWRQNN